MHLRTSGGRRPVVFTLASVALIAAAALAPTVTGARSRRASANQQAGPSPLPTAAGQPLATGQTPAALPPDHGSAGLAPPPDAASVKLATPCGSCDDGDPCTVDRCDAQTGQCVHPPVVCDDLNSCTFDSCQPDTGCRFDPVPDGTACAGSPDACRTGGACHAGECVETQVNCDDGNACTGDYCDGNTGQCVHQAVLCGDGNGCTLDACDPQTGQCQYTLLPEGASCDDGNPCTVASSCRDVGMGQPQCVGTPTPGAACDDQNPCTLNDTCVDNGPGFSYCQGTQRDCSDGDACTSDLCDSATGQCLHQALTCNDKNPCTSDTCDPASGCHSTQLPDHTACDDLSSCTVNDRCTFGSHGYDCYGTTTVGAVCDDGNPCSTGDACFSDGRGGAFCRGQQLECGDGNACTQDVCDSNTGACRSGPQNCNDGNTCTVDSCSMAAGGCQYEPRPDGTLCDDFNPCSTGETCQQGSCFGGAQVSCDDQQACTADQCDYKTGACLHTTTTCDDGNPCTDDACDSVTGACTFVPRPDGTACNDQNACTQGDTCQAGRCTGTAPPACDDGNPCTTDVCDPATGACLSVPISCSDFDPCTIDSCDALSGQCLHTPLSCDDGNACTADVCQPGTGQCQHQPANEGRACDDGNACTSGTFCQAGACLGGTPVTCDDGNTCTRDSCDPATGCVYAPVPDGGKCSDGSLCTSNDHCSAGQCVGTLLNCNDGNVCTTDTCNPSTGRCEIVGLPDGTACDDGNACTPGDQCLGGRCSGGPPPVCDDGNACTHDSCDPATGACRFLTVTCDDQNPCTADSCDPSGGCRYDPLPNDSPCDDANACTLGESCQYGQCVGLPKSCANDTLCDYDVCDPQTGACSHPPKCGDQNGCTDDVCDPQVGVCQYMPRPAGSSCDDNNPCTSDETCIEGMPGGPLFCHGVSHVGIACDDGSPCTENDTCVDFGAADAFCTGTQKSCADGDLCSYDYCDSSSGACLHQPLTCNDNNPCTVDSCGPQEGQCTFAPVATGTACSDPSGCITGGVCGMAPGGKGITCNGTPNLGAVCDDHNSCTDADRCRSDGRGGAFCSGTGIDCEDGLTCTIDTCDQTNGQCRQTPATCDDGNACTRDVCDPATGSCGTQPAPLYEVGTVIFPTPGSQFFWPPTPGGTRWNVYRGTIGPGVLGTRLPGSVYDHVCFESADAAGDGALISNDPSIPPLDTAYYYDVTSESDCGEGPLGSDSDGGVRPNPAPCPTPP